MDEQNEVYIPLSERGDIELPVWSSTNKDSSEHSSRGQQIEKKANGNAQILEKEPREATLPSSNDQVSDAPVLFSCLVEVKSSATLQSTSDGHRDFSKARSVFDSDEESSQDEKEEKKPRLPSSSYQSSLAQSVFSDLAPVHSSDTLQGETRVQLGSSLFDKAFESDGDTNEMSFLLRDERNVSGISAFTRVRRLMRPANFRCTKSAGEIYRSVVHFVAKDLQDHNTDFPFRLAKTEWKNFRRFVAGSSFVANKIWAPVFWAFLLWDLFPGLALADPLYGVSFGRIMGGIADNAITVSSIWGSDVAGEWMFYIPTGVIGLGMASGGALWTWPLSRSRLEPQIKAFHEKLLLESSVYRDFIQWKAGSAPVSWKDVPFWLIAIGTLYANIRFFELCILKFMGFLRFEMAKTACNDQNKLWVDLNDWGNFECVVSNAGYLPDYRKFTSQLALDQLFALPRDPDFILTNIDELLKHSFRRIDLSRQNWRIWPRPTFRALLSKISAHVKAVPTFNVSSDFPYSSFPDDGRLEDLVEFSRNVTISIFSAINQGIGQTGFEELWEPLVSQLLEIEVGGNNIQAVPTLLNATGITRFSAPRTLLGDTGVTGISNSHVSDIDLSDVGMTGQGVTSLSQEFAQAQVKKIKVANNNFQGADMKPLAEGFANSNVEEADFSSTQLVDSQVDDLTSVQSKTMKKWKFRNNGLTNVGLFSAVKNCRNTTVTDLDVFGNAIDDDGVSSSIGFLPDTTLEHLGLGNTAITAESIKQLGQSGKVKSVDASYNQIGADVVNMIMQNKVLLEALDLTFTGLNTDAGVKLVGVLPGSAFKSLILGNNNLHDPFLIAFANALPNTGIVVFDLSLNQVTDASVTVLAKMLPQSKLESMNFDNNPAITDVSGVPLVQAFVEPTAEANTIGQDQVGRYEARALRNANLIVKLKEVSLRGTNIGRPTIRAAEEVLSGRDFTFNTNCSSQFYANPPVQLRLASSANSNTNTMAAGAIGLGFLPSILLFFVAVSAIYVIYRTSKYIYSQVNSEGTPSCKK